MEIKGNIGDEVFLKAKLTGANIYEDGSVVYLVKCGEENFMVDSSEVKFEEKKAAVPKKKEEKKAAAPEAPKRRPGRPKKATVEGTMAKYEEMINRAKSMDAGLKG